jgi:double-stranded uracil-DNA glycosylase
MNRVESFPAFATATSRILILGTMPGKLSLAQQQYYAHPRNAFWPIIGELFAIDPRSEYKNRTAQLAAANVALWDVLRSCVRDGSLDTAIEPSSMVANTVAELLTAHPSIQRIAFNGATAAKLYRRHIQPMLTTAHANIEYFYLPSTSPAHAGMSYENKLNAWRVITM